MRALTRLALAIVLLAPGPAWAAVVAVPTVAPVPAVVAPISAPAAGLLSPASPSLISAATLSPALAPAAAPAALAAPSAQAAASPAAAAFAAQAAAPALAAASPAAAEPASPAAAAPALASAQAAPAAAAESDAPKRRSRRAGGAAAPPAAPAPDESAETARARAGRDFDGTAERPDLDAAPVAAAKPARGGKRAPPPLSPSADDGGGPDYPYRTITFRGRDYRSVYFRPNIPVEAELVHAIDSAQRSIHLALYEFKQTDVLNALRRARDRGVEIHIVLDYSNVFPQSQPDDDYKPRRSNEIWALLREDFDVKVLRGLGQYGINHNKIAVIDQELPESLATFGSYNWSFTAETSHYENANFTVERKRVAALMQYWTWLSQQAQPVHHGANAEDYAWPTTVPAPPISVPLDVEFNGVRLPWMILSPNRTPGETFEDRLAQAMGATKKSIDVSIFALRSTKIAAAMAAALKRGVNVRLIMDEGQASTDVFGVYAQWLAYQEKTRGPRDGHIEVRTLAGPDPGSDFPLAQKNHHKFSILDGKLVETGSANYTKYAAEANFENANFLDDATDVRAYAYVFEHNWAKAKPFAAPAAAPTLPTDAELRAELDKEAPPIAPRPPLDAPADMPQARRVEFNGEVFPSFAFRPYTPIEPLVVKAIRSAKKTLRVALYEFTLDSVMDELRAAKKRGVKIEIVIDQSHVYTRGVDSHRRARMPSAQIQALIAEDFDVVTLKGEKSGIMHNKFVLADADEAQSLLMFGSYNIARTAEDNHYENVKFSNDKRRIAHYRDYFEYMREHASPLDHDKYEQTLARSDESAAAERAEPEDAAEAAGALEAEADEFDAEAARRRGPDENGRDSKFPPPPEDKATPIDLNGEKFQLDYFSPQGGIRDAWIRAVHAAEESVEIAMFSFYSRPIADALVELQKIAAKKGIKIRLVLDAGQASLAKFDGVPVGKWFAQQGFDVRLNAGPHDDGDPMYEKQHSKFILVDRKFLMTGSFNASDNADQNSFENDNASDDPTDIAGYVWFFEQIFARGWNPIKGRSASGAGKAPAPMPGA
jgi:phosphatidylserine/phosphatidylglycerophosphate/cardiolipin synthase-like enzyme